MKSQIQIKSEYDYKITNLSKKLLISIPYRDRNKQYSIFFDHIKTYFMNDKFDKNLNVRICFIEQSNQKPFNLGSLNNVGFLVNENYWVRYIPTITFYGLNNQINPMIGRDLVLPVFAATIVGGIGSVYGALLGGIIVGLASNLALSILPSGYSPSVPFIIILAVLLIRPNGLFGEARA